MLPLILAPNPLLKQVATPVPLPLTQSVTALANNMIKAMWHYQGIGLAAPQIGESLQLIVVSLASGPTICINPKITKSSWRKIEMEEGCLSIPGVYGLVKRPARIVAQFLDLSGNLITQKLTDLPARIYQHEVDHLNGILFIDRDPKILAGAELLSKYTAKADS